MQKQNDRRDRWFAAQASQHGISESEFRAWKAQRDMARHRGIPFHFTPLGWAIWWKVELARIGGERGRKRGQYVMARFQYRGAYELGNVRAITHADNHKDRHPADIEATRYKRIGQARLHLRDRLRHPRARRIATDDGVIFASAALAGEHYGITRQTAAARAR